ncbi:MAG: PP2C family protein-serine/threonine phosphatase [Acidothermaceae bacterium]
MNRPLPRPLTLVVVSVCIVLALGLAWVARAVNTHSNDRLLSQEVQQAAASLSSALPVVQSQLSQTAEVAIQTNARPDVFARFTAAQLKSSGIVAISLWQVKDGAVHQLAIQSKSPSTGLALVGQHLDASFFAGVHPSDQLFVTKIIPGSPPRLGYASMPADDTAGVIVYAESVLPAGGRVTLPSSSPFHDLKFAIYLGNAATPAQLLEATTATPIRGQTASTSVPFGNTAITLVGSRNAQLAGGLSGALPWIVLAVGVGLALASGSTLEYVGRRRAVAEGLARDNERLYREQRDIAITLQHALLPEVPTIDGVEIGARYFAGVAGMDVGGDWYDVVRIDAQRFVFFVGDVSGRGLHAATTMASLRYAVRAYVAQGDDIATVLTKVGGLLDIETDQHFATLLAGDVDLATQRVSIASAGHFLPLLVSGGMAEFVSGDIEPPIGIASSPQSITASFEAPPKATLIAFTDGAVERRGENIDIGLDRLRNGVVDDGKPLDALLDGLIARLVPDGADDDVVILAVRWQV